jgi:hypothetical protein
MPILLRSPAIRRHNGRTGVVGTSRIVEARVNHLIQDRDGIKLQVDFGHDETALIEICRC